MSSFPRSWSVWLGCLLGALAGPARGQPAPAGALTLPPHLVVLTADPHLSLEMGPLSVVMRDGGHQPFLFCTAQGTLFCQSELQAEPYRTKPKMVYPRRIGTAISRDRGRTWKRWTYQEGHDDVFIEGGAVQCRDGSIVLLNTYVMEPKPPHGIAEVWRSHDDLRTIQGPSYVECYLPHLHLAGTEDRPDVQRDYARLHRSVIEMPNGDLLATMYTTFDGDTAPSGYLASQFKTRDVIVRSRDQGASWRYLSTVAFDSAVGTEGYNEGTLVRVSRGRHAGRLVCFTRTGRALYGTHSDDDGRTWAVGQPVTAPGVDIYDTAKWASYLYDTKDRDYVPNNELLGAMVNPDLIEMRDGTLVCAVGVRIPARQSLFGHWKVPSNGNYLIFSLDGGDTWSEVVRYTSGVPTTHYAGVREIAPGRLYVVYDNSVRQDPVGVEHAIMGFSLTVNRSP